MKAVWNDTLIAESDATIELGGDQYFPASSVDMDYLEASTHQTTSPRTGTARYYDIVVDGERCENAAWYYPEPNTATRDVEDHIAFTSDVDVTE